MMRRTEGMKKKLFLSVCFLHSLLFLRTVLKFVKIKMLFIF
jgi:hypothetical protein